MACAFNKTGGAAALKTGLATMMQAPLAAAGTTVIIFQLSTVGHFVERLGPGMWQSCCAFATGRHRRAPQGWSEKPGCVGQSQGTSFLGSHSSASSFQQQWQGPPPQQQNFQQQQQFQQPPQQQQFQQQQNFQQQGQQGSKLGFSCALSQHGLAA